MRTNAIVPAITALVALTGEARAQHSEPKSWFLEPIAGPSRAFELTVGSGYTQGIGMLRGSRSLPSVASAGFAFDLGAGARLNERLAVALVAQYHELAAEGESRGIMGGFAVTYHGAPSVRFDPWLELGTGYRALWQRRTTLNPAAFTQGISLLRVRIGADLRVAREVAIGPVIGADMNVFLWEKVITSRAIDDVRLNTFVFAGIQGRMDIGGTKR